MTSTLSPRRRPLWLVWGYCLLLAAGCLLFCSKCSPLYPINDWTDTNIFFTMGKGMARGRVLYRDLYDHKGPLLYALYALCYLAFPLSFTGVWLLEVLSFSLFLLSIYRLTQVYQASQYALWALPVTAFAIAASLSFQQGGSAEELALPMLGWSLVELLAYLRQQAPRPMVPRRLMLHGLLCGCVLWMKFTLLGLYLGWIVVLFLCQARLKHGRATSLLWFALGVALATLPWLVYFGLNGALLPWLKTYLYDNLFLYTAGEEATGLLNRGKVILQAFGAWFVGNLYYTPLLALGLLWGLIHRPTKPWERTALWLPMALCAAGAFAGGKAYLYYGLVVASCVGLGVVPLCQWLDRRLGGHPHRPGLQLGIPAGLCALCLLLCYALSPNTATSFLTPREETMQYQLAAHITEGPEATLLNYGFMDAGFYTATGITPSVKYFHRTNVPLQDMLDEQIRYIDEGLCTYVITRGKQPDSLYTLYDLVATADSPGFWYPHVYLYRLR